MSGMTDAIAWFEASEAMLRVTHGDEVADEAMAIAARLRGDGEQGQPFGHWLQDSAGVGYFTRGATPALLAAYASESDYVSTALYERPQPVAGDAVRALRELRDEALRGSFADTLSGDHDAVKRMLRRIADQCDAALSTQPAPSAPLSMRAAKALLSARTHVGAERPDDEDEAAWWDELTELADALALSAPSEQVAASVAVPEGWADAYAAFVGAFDTPVAWHRDRSEHAEDARSRLREFNRAMLAAAPVAPEREG